MDFLEQTWRWFGPQDGVSLQDVKQAGATGIVSALHYIPCGETWPVTDIQQRKKAIEDAGLNWSVVESVNVHESIKTGKGDRNLYIDQYIETLRNLAACGMKTVCYNFMPVLDWTRTDLDYRLKDGSSALRYDAIALAAFELYLLKREGAENEYSEVRKKEAQSYLDTLDEGQVHQLVQTVMAGLPGTDDVFTMDEFRTYLDVYKDIDAKKLKENLFYFLSRIIPEAETLGIRMCIHPDDPPFPILGLPRVMGTESDIREMFEAVPSYHNGLTFCTGSLGGRGDNDLPGIIDRLGDRIHFIHLRNVRRDGLGGFYEADHLDGSVDMPAVMHALVRQQQKRFREGRKDVSIPMRPDHGHVMLDDLNSKKKFFPGYSTIGRLRGLAELRGLEAGIRKMVS